MITGKKIKAFFGDNVGKITLSAGVGTVVAIGSVIALPVTSVLYTAALVSSGVGSVLTSGLTGAWMMKEHLQTQDKEVRDEKLQALQQQMRLYEQNKHEQIERDKKHELELMEIKNQGQIVKETNEDLQKVLKALTALKISQKLAHEETIARVNVVNEEVIKGNADLHRLGTNPNTLFHKSSTEDFPFPKDEFLNKELADFFTSFDISRNLPH